MHSILPIDTNQIGYLSLSLSFNANNSSVQDEHTRQEYTTACMPAPKRSQTQTSKFCRLQFLNHNANHPLKSKFCNSSNTPSKSSPNVFLSPTSSNHMNSFYFLVKPNTSLPHIPATRPRRFRNRRLRPTIRITIPLIIPWSTYRRSRSTYRS